jgi:WD40 repeat protein
MRYNAFISYSHAADAGLAPALQSGLHRFARPWYRMRALRIFRDATNLSVSPGLWSSIEKELAEAEYFLLLASPEAAASPWIAREIDFWLTQRSPERLLIVLSDGKICWDQAVGDFDWVRTTALPRRLSRVFREEPFYLDFRDLKTSHNLSWRNPAFRDHIAYLAATLHGRSKDEMIGEDVRQYRRTRRLAWAASIGLFVLAAAASTAAVVAIGQRNVAERRRQIAVGREMVTRAEQLRGERPELHQASLLLGVEGLRRLERLGASTREADRALRNAMTLSPLPVTVFEHDGPILRFAWNPDGQQLAAGTARGSVRLWDLRQPNRSTSYTHDGPIGAVAFSPDGTLLASASWDGSVQVIGLGDDKRVTQLTHHQPVRDLAFSPDGRWLVTAGADGFAHVWELATTTRVHATLSHGATVAGVRFSPDGRFLILVGADGAATLFDVRTMTHKQQLRFPKSQLDTVTFSADSRRFAARSRDSTFLLHAELEKQIARIDERVAAEGWVEGVNWSEDAIAFSLDNRWLASAHRDRSARLASAESGEEVRRTLHNQPVRGVAFSADSTKLATRSGSVVQLWDTMSGREVARMPHDDNVRRMAFAPGGDLIATIAGKQVRVWRTTPGNPVLSLPHVRGVWRHPFSPDGRWFVTQEPTRVVSIWDAASAERVAQLRHPDLIRGTGKGVRFSPDSRLIATACNDNRVRVWEVTTGKVVATIAEQQTADALSFSPDGQWLAFVTSADGQAGSVMVWDWAKDKRVFQRDAKGRELDVAFSPDNRFLAIADGEPSLHLVDLRTTAVVASLPGFTFADDPFSRDGRWLLGRRGDVVAVFEAGSERPKATLQAETNITSAALSPDGKYAAGVADSSVIVWDVSSGRVAARLEHALAVNMLAFSPNSRWLLTGSGDPIHGRGEARIWNVTDGSEAALLPHDRGVWAVGFNVDGRRFFTLSRDLPTQIWIAASDDLLTEACRRSTRNLTYGEWKDFLADEPYLKICPRLAVHPSLGEAAAKLILAGDEQSGLNMFERILNLDEPGSHTANEVRQSAADGLVAHGEILARSDQLPKAIQAFRRAQEIKPRDTIGAEAWNALARHGATRGHAPEVLFAAEEAVRLEPNDPNYRDTRGLARALTGDVNGALEDFAEFARRATAAPPQLVQRRKRWIEDLTAGKNPFTEQVLARLRDE